MRTHARTRTHAHTHTASCNTLGTHSPACATPPTHTTSRATSRGHVHVTHVVRLRGTHVGGAFCSGAACSAVTSVAMTTTRSSRSRVPVVAPTRPLVGSATRVVVVIVVPPRSRPLLKLPDLWEGRTRVTRSERRRPGNATCVTRCVALTSSDYLTPDTHAHTHTHARTHTHTRTHTLKTNSRRRMYTEASYSSVVHVRGSISSGDQHVLLESLWSLTRRCTKKMGQMG